MYSFTVNSYSVTKAKTHRASESIYRTCVGVGLPNVIFFYPIKINISTAPVTKASIKIVGSQPILNHTFTLACETAGMVESITWTHGQFPLYADNTRNLSMDNTTLTFDPVMKSDNGHYQCVASNPLSMLTSEIFMLNVFCEYSMYILRPRTHF